ncbi:MAG: hypothetical protein WC314_12760 [Vulcanimicrobiota bacterium]
MTNLFDRSTFVPTRLASQPHFKTPLGVLELSVSVAGKCSSELSPKAFQNDDLSAQVFVYSLDEAAVELLLCPAKTLLPNGMSVEGSRASILRVSSEINDLKLSYCCCWSPKVPTPEGGPSCGEHLEAMTWDSKDTMVSLGTPDEEYLVWRVGREIPTRWREFLSASDGWGFYVHPLEDRGTIIESPGLMKGESCELYFKVAWSEYREDDCSTWFAVDVCYDKDLPWWPGQDSFVVNK